VVACDTDARRLATVQELARRLGLASVETCLLSEDLPPPAGPFDKVLVDVPCSNTGVLGRRPEARWRLRPDDLRQLVALQTRLLGLGVERLRPGGAVVYSTCSIEPEENARRVRAFTAENASFVIESEIEALPAPPGSEGPVDGGYAARMRRSD